jgi:hypothetical protein
MPSPEKPTPAPEKPAPAPEKPKPASDKTSHQDQDPDVIRNGEGYTYSAIRLLGLVPRNGSKHDVEHAFQEMTKEQRAEVEELVRALKEANKNKHHGVLYAGERINTDDAKVQAILNPEED